MRMGSEMGRIKSKSIDCSRRSSVPTIVSKSKQRRKCPCLLAIFIGVLVLLDLAAHSVDASSKSYYHTLGVSKKCSDLELKKAYRKAVLKHHPDKGGKEETFKEIQKAYEILSDPQTRKRYDQFGEAAERVPHNSQQQQQQSGGGMPFFNTSPRPASPSFGFGGVNHGREGPGFSQMGGFGTGSDFDLEKLLRGGTGSGMEFNLDELIRQYTNAQNGGRQSTRRTSRTTTQTELKTYQFDLACSLEDLYHGVTKKMKVNFGNSVIRPRVYNVQLKRHWKEGTKIKYERSEKYPAVTFTVKEKKHTIFQRRKDDLIYRYVLPELSNDSPTVSITIPLVNGTVWTRKLPTKSSLLKKGQSLTVPNLGMPMKAKGDSGFGSLIIEFC